MCGYNKNMELIILPPTITNIASYTFRECGTFVMICKATTPPSLGSVGTAPQKIYVPEGYADAYRTTTNWSTYATRIFPISQLVADNEELFNEIYEYIKDIL